VQIEEMVNQARAAQEQVGARSIPYTADIMLAMHDKASFCLVYIMLVQVKAVEQRARDLEKQLERGKQELLGFKQEVRRTKKAQEDVEARHKVSESYVVGLLLE
jgi:lipid II:glycine glycyltransferase (peptidoglycan interpeptide bridge formation enzyme)